MKKIGICIWLFFSVAATASVFPAQAEEKLPLPRFVSVRSSEVNVRTGPGVRYEVKWTVVRKSIPLEVIAEFEQWRKIRDVQGEEGWVHASMLTGKRTAIIMSDHQILRRSVGPGSPPVAMAEAGVVAEILSCKGTFCRVRAGDYAGWLDRANIWGVYEQEEIE